MAAPGVDRGPPEGPQPSEAEGFGLPVAGALACSAAVLASAPDVLREVGGAAADYTPAG